MSNLNPTSFTFTDKEIHDCAGKLLKELLVMNKEKA